MIAFLLLSQTFLPKLMSGQKKLIFDFNVGDWLWSFWDTNVVNGINDTYGMPVNFPFWFIRDLMVVMIFSPLVYWIIKWLKQYAVILLLGVWVLGASTSITGLSVEAFSFFTAGAYFGINGKNFVTILQPYTTPIVLFYVFVVLLELCIMERNGINASYMRSVSVILGAATAITVSSHCIQRGIWRVSTFLADSSFFIYAYHAMPQIFINKIMFKLLHPHSDFSLLFLYILCPTLTILVGLTLYYGLKKLLPRFTAVITGGR